MHEMVSPEELLHEGQAAYQRGEFIQAAHTFEAAAQGYSVSEDVLSAAEMRNNASVAFLRAGEAKAALEAVQETVPIFARAGDTRRHGMALGNLGAALEGLGRLNEAIQAYIESGELLKKAGEHDFRAQVMQSLSALQLKTGQQMEAIASMQAGLEDLPHPSIKQRFLKKLLGTPFKLLMRK